MKKIALVELQEHQEVLFGLMELLLLQEVELYIFAPQPMYLEWGRGQEDQIQWYTKNLQEPIPVFVSRYRDQLDSVDLIIFTTLISHFAFFSRQKFLPPTLLLIHKGNAFFNPRANLQILNFKDVLRYLRWLWWREEFYRRKFLQQIRVFSFADESIRKYMQPTLPNAYTILPALPLSYFEPYISAASEQVSIVVPGTVSSLTRDYDLLFEALHKIDTQLLQRIKLTFLGKAKGEKAKVLFAWIKSSTFQNIEIQTHNELIPAQEYQAALQQANFLILPLRVQIRFGLIHEYYGKTSISGGINDMLHHGKPALLPGFYPLTPPLDALTQRFAIAQELADLCTSWVNEKIYQSIEKQAKESLEAFNKSRQSERLMQILHSGSLF